MKKPHFFQRIHLSLYSADFYKMVIKEHFMKAFLYYILLVVLCIIPFATVSVLGTMDFYKSTETILSNPDCPDFTVKNGKVEFIDQEPFVYEKDNKIIIFDPQNLYGYNDIIGYKVGCLIQPNNVLYSEPGMDPQRLNNLLFFVNIPGGKDAFLRDITFMKPITLTVLVAMIFFAGILYSLALSLLGSLMAYFTQSSLGLSLSYPQAYKYGIYCMTFPVILIGILFAFFPSHAMSMHFFIFFFVTSILLYRNLSGIIKSS